MATELMREKKKEINLFIHGSLTFFKTIFKLYIHIENKS